MIKNIKIIFGLISFVIVIIPIVASVILFVIAAQNSTMAIGPIISGIFNMNNQYCFK